MDSRIREVAVFCGVQEWPGREPLELWNLRVPMGRYPVNSTVSREVIVGFLSRPGRAAFASARVLAVVAAAVFLLLAGLSLVGCVREALEERRDRESAIEEVMS